MKNLNFGAPPPNDFAAWVEDCFREIERASLEDVESIVSEFRVTGTVTTLRTINAETATVDDLRNFVATLITDIKRRGQKRSYG
jgi:hypothetical protein